MGNFSDNVPEKEKRGVFKFFDIVYHRFSKLVGLNLLYTICSLPVIAVYFALTSLVSTSLLPVDAGTITASDITTLSGIISIFLFVILGGGPLSPGFIYVIRNFCRREHAFVWSDFFEHIKNNFKQSIVIFIIDVIVMFFMFFNLNALISTPEIFFGYSQPFAIVMALVFVLYVAARMYLYPLMVTFDSPLKTIIKTSIMLCMLKLPQSIIMVLFTFAVFYVIQLFVPFVFLALFVTPVFLASFIGVMWMIYAYGVIVDNVAMGSGEKNQ